MEPSALATKEKSSKKINGLSDALIITAFSLIMISLVFNWMSDYVQPPEFDDFSGSDDPSDAYESALSEHQEKIRAYEGIYSLFSSIGVVMLVAGLFYKTVNGSEHLPDWVRVAMMVGVLYFMIRLFTNEISLLDTIELLTLLES